jgi:hypothetical protein
MVSMSPDRSLAGERARAATAIANHARRLPSIHLDRFARDDGLTSIWLSAGIAERKQTRPLIIRPPGLAWPGLAWRADLADGLSGHSRAGKTH